MLSIVCGAKARVNRWTMWAHTEQIRPCAGQLLDTEGSEEGVHIPLIVSTVL